jgi:CRP-like cAMP-binding protein
MNDTASTLLRVLPDGLPDAIGVLGLILYLGSYLALQLGLIRGDDWVFPSFILAASLSMIVSLTARFNPYSMLVEVSWAVISVIGLIRLYIIHRYSFSDEEQAAAKRLGPGLAKDRVRKLLSLGNWSDARPGHVLTREGQPVTHFVYVASGVCRIQIDGTNVASIGTGGLIGEMTYHTGQPATATVIVDAASRILAFERDALESFLDRNEDIRAALEQSVAGDLRQKLAATTQTLTENRRDAKGRAVNAAT